MRHVSCGQSPGASHSGAAQSPSTHSCVSHSFGSLHGAPGGHGRHPGPPHFMPPPMSEHGSVGPPPSLPGPVGSVALAPVVGSDMVVWPCPVDPVPSDPAPPIRS